MHCSMQQLICIVPNCGSTKGKTTEVTFHEFPSNNEFRDTWIRNIPRRDNWAPSERSKVCSLHFTPDCFREHIRIRCLKKDAIPTIFPECSTYLQSEIEIVKIEPAPMRQVKCYSRKKRKLSNDENFSPGPQQQWINELNGITAPIEDVTQNSESSRITNSRNYSQTSVVKNKLVTDTIQSAHFAVTNWNNFQVPVVKNEFNKTVAPIEEITDTSQLTRFAVTNSKNYSRTSIVKNELEKTIAPIEDITDTSQSPYFMGTSWNDPSRLPVLENELDMAIPPIENATEASRATHFSVANPNRPNHPYLVPYDKSSVWGKEKSAGKILTRLKSSIQEVSKLRLRILELKQINEDLEKTLEEAVYYKKYDALEKQAKAGSRSSLFIMEQVQRLGDKKQPWSEQTLRLCTLWRENSSSSYEHVRASGLLHLPLHATLKRYKTKIAEISRRRLDGQCSAQSTVERFLNLTETSLMPMLL